MSVTCGIKFATRSEKLMYHDMYRLINCTVRYLDGTAKDSTGGYLYERLRNHCPTKFLEVIFTSVKKLSSHCSTATMEKMLAPFAQFHQDKTTNGDYDMPFTLSSFKGLLRNIHWDSNVLDVDWNPDTFVDRAGSTQTIWVQKKSLTAAGPTKFIEWVRMTFKPLLDPMYILLYILKSLNMLNPFNFLDHTPTIFFLPDVSPR